MTISTRVLLLLLVSSCHSGSPASRASPTRVDVAVAQAPFADVDVQWKERLEGRYVYRELVGDYRGAWAELEAFLQTAAQSGFTPAGAPFCLFYDDPGSVPVQKLRARICLPVDPEARSTGSLDEDVLPGGTVAYAVIAAEHGAVPQSYPAIYRFLDANGWVENGPLREILLRAASGDDPPWTEVQVPWRAAAR